MERKRMLYKSKVEYMSGEGVYTMNHILGCSHGCLYPCYAFTSAKRYGQVDSYARYSKESPRYSREPWMVDRAAELPRDGGAHPLGGAEAVEEYRKGRDPREIYYNGEKPEGIPIELADAVIRILDYCEFAGIDLESAISIKARYNESRPYRHGGKVI